jgi:hypothetical protein
MNSAGYWFFGVIALTACGGKVVVDPDPGQGGHTGMSSSSSGVVSSSSTSSGSDCNKLGAEYVFALNDAVVCNACLDSPQCTGAIVPDLCGCPTQLNSQSSPEALGAQMALANFKAAGCAFNVCDMCPSMVAGPPCQPKPGSCDGTCQVLAPPPP